MNNVFEITKELNIGERDIQLYLDAYVDGELVFSKKADSLVTNFLSGLYAHMSSIKGAAPLVISAGRFPIIGATNTAPIVVDTGTNNLSGYVGQHAFISGVEGNLAANGDFVLASAGGGSPHFTLTLQSSTGSGAYTQGGIIEPYITSTFNRAYTNFQFAGIAPGLGSGSVAITDSKLNMPIGNGSGYKQLVYNSGVVSQDTADSVSAQITMTQTFTNSSGNLLTVYEVGLYLLFGGSICMAARDLILSEIGINNGATLTLNYRIKTILGTTGGFIQTFMQQLYRQIGNNNRTVLDITNTNQTNGQNYSSFLSASAGGLSEANIANGVYAQTQGQTLGIVVGTSNTAVSMTDFALTSRIQHGSGSGQLYYHGCTIDSFNIDTISNVAYFNIIRLVENISAGSITIKEMGIYSAADSNSTQAVFPTVCHCIVHDALPSPSWVTLAPGDVGKIVYKIQITL